MMVFKGRGRRVEIKDNGAVHIFNEEGLLAVFCPTLSLARRKIELTTWMTRFFCYTAEDVSAAHQYLEDLQWD